MADSTRLRLPDERRRRLDSLDAAMGEITRAGAIDTAARYYARMAGYRGRKEGMFEELKNAAVERGSLTPVEIAPIVDTPELPVGYEHEWAVGASE